LVEPTIVGAGGNPADVSVVMLDTGDWAVAPSIADACPESFMRYSCDSAELEEELSVLFEEDDTSPVGVCQ
jgi:hypothetical protein